MKKEKFDKLFEQAIENAVVKDNHSLELKKRFDQIEQERENVLHIPQITQTDLILELGRKAAFMHTQPISTNSLPVTDETILLFLNSEDEKSDCDDENEEVN